VNVKIIGHKMTHKALFVGCRIDGGEVHFVQIEPFVVLGLKFICPSSTVIRCFKETVLNLVLSCDSILRR